MTPDDDATPERGRRAARGRRSAAATAPAPRRARPARARADRGRTRADDRAEDPPGPDWVPRWVRRVDRRILVTTLVAMLVAAVIGGTVAAFGLGLIFVTDACDVDSYVCRDSLFTIGYGTAVAGPLVLTGVALIVALVGMIRGRTRPWLVLLIGVGASLAAYILGAVLVLVAVPGSSPVT
ncbi:hypothetical protein [Clavibacter capsici]|uniref:Uncharacterized protein n=1 Tax=Clavibacter capsici TaxID=1874630 RepID=A0AAE6XPC7_9MICO|nr:hypothetical protein [Clavibacter capsici]ALD11853.1 hypothetical protein AES38_01840 [Clavibacter capsici]QIS43926.1 hypothetical protein GW570_01845 [Clavibacter capsici]